MTVFLEFSDPRLAAVYDALGPDGRDTDFYLTLAAELAASSVIDIGCRDQVRWIDGEAWQAWTRHASLRQADDGAGGRFEWWYELTEVLGGGELVRSEVHYRFSCSAEEIISPNELRFRARTTLTRQLMAAGFLVEHVFGGWDRRPASPDTPEMIFVAVRR